MNEWDAYAKFQVLDDYGCRRLRVKIIRAFELEATGWFPHFFIRIRGTHEEWRQTRTVKGVDPVWEEVFELDVSGGVLELELWEAPPWGSSSWWDKVLKTTETTEDYARVTLADRLSISLREISSPFPEKDTPHLQTFYFPNLSRNGEPAKSRLQLEFTPINFGTQPTILIRKFLDSHHLLMNKGDKLMRGFGPNLDGIDLSSVIQGISVMSDESIDVESKAQLHVRVADVEFFYYYFNYYEHVYYFKTHLRMADNSALVHKEGALDRHQVTALVSFHVQYLTLAFTFLLGLVSIALKTFIYKKEDVHPELKEIYNQMTKGGLTRKDVEPRQEGEDEEERCGLIPLLYEHMFLENQDISDGRPLEQEYMNWFFHPGDSERIRFGSELQKRCKLLLTKLEEKSHSVLERLLDSVEYL